MSLERDFEEFEGGPNISSRHRLHVTIRPDGAIYMNMNTHRLMGKPQAVKLFYSRERDTIAVCPADPRQPKNFVLKKADEYGGYWIRSAPFCSHYRIRVAEVKRFVDADIDAAGYLILDLRRTVNATSKKWKQRRQA